MKALLTLTGFMLSMFAAASGFNLSEVRVTCDGPELCRQREARFRHLKGEYRSLVHLRDTLRIMASDGGYQSFTYELFEQAGAYELNINMRLKPVVEEIRIRFTDKNLNISPAQLISLNEGDFFEPLRLQESGEVIKRRLENLGYPDSSHRYEVIEKNGKVTVNYAITLGRPRRFRSVRVQTKSSYVNEFLQKKFNVHYNRPFEISKLKQTLDEAQRELFTYGYYLLALDMTPVITGDRVLLDIRVSNEQLFSFDFRGIVREERESLLNVVRDLFRRFKRPLPENTIRQTLREHYESLAMMNTRVQVKTSQRKNKFNEMVTHYQIKITEGQKTRMRNISFSGNNFFSDAHLRRMFDKEAFELASINYYDKEFLTYFANYLKTEYIQSGYVQARILEPLRVFDDDKREVRVEFNIQEGPRAMVRKVSILGVPPELEDQILKGLTNRKGDPLNPITLADDIKKVAIILQEQGHYFAEVINASDDEIVSYNPTGTEVDISISVDPGPLVRLNRVLILGNNKTLKRVIEKKVFIKSNDLITPSKTRDIESSLSATGLFASVSATPLRHSSRDPTTDLIVKVSERDYGLVEFAPGYRTDLGIKLTGTASYLNIGGKNQALTLRGQVNQRLNYQTLDPARRQDNLNFIEYNTTLNFTQGDIFDSLIDYNAGLSFQRRSFSPFDADIVRFNNTFTRDFTKTFSTSLRYQYETITQWNAVEARDDGSFRIGAITPIVTWDLRNSQVLPTSGSFYNLSCEIANPYLLSQQTPDLTIHYYKLVSRNRFYIPFPNGTFAISAVAGVQENLARDTVMENGSPVIIDGREQTTGHIPNIKVFRLTGMDIVRGFNDEEINRLTDGQDISRVRIQNRAFLANFKFEPRYFVNDNLMAGLFLDAGRVFVDQVDPMDLRSSAGVTFKILTPVGTLDFDYGHKLNRRRLPDGQREDAGRFHVSIGFF
jgi:outer membrane protein insertion porin family